MYLLPLGVLGPRWGGHGEEGKRSPGLAIGEGGGRDKDNSFCIHRDSDRVDEGRLGSVSGKYNTTCSNDTLGLAGEDREGVGNGYKETLMGALTGRAVAVRCLVVARVLTMGATVGQKTMARVWLQRVATWHVVVELLM